MNNYEVSVKIDDATSELWKKNVKSLNALLNKLENGWMRKNSLFSLQISVSLYYTSWLFIFLISFLCDRISFIFFLFGTL